MPDPFKQVKIIELMELFDDDEVTTADQIDRPQQALDREAYEDFMKRNPLAGGGMLVEPGFGGVRQGYAKEKPLIKREQNIFKNYLKARKEVGLNVPSDDNKQKIKSKIRTGTIDNQTIKNLKETYRYKNEDQRLRYDTKLKRWEKIAGRDRKTYIQKKDETKSQFLKRVENITSLSQTKARKKQDTATKKARIYIDNWTKDWLDNNLEKYGVRNFNKMITNLKKDWQKNVKTLKMDKGFLQSWSTKAGLPNVTPSREISFGLKPFNYNGVPFYTSAEVTKAPLSQWRGLFFRDKIQNIPGFRQKILDYFNFMNLDKRGLYMQEGFKTIKAYKDIADKNVVYLLSPDANLISSAKYNLFNSIDDEFSEAYNTYTKKVNKSKQWKKSAALIEKTLGLKPRYIQNSMNRERAALAKLFDVKQLPEELRYTLEHGQGLSAAASTGNKEIMERAVNDLIGTTVRQNTALGFGGFEQTRNSLIRDIRAGVNVKDNLNSLNKLVGDAYKDFGIKDKIYSIQDGQLTTRNISPATTREQRFTQYFKQIDKTPEGRSAIKKQYGSLENLLLKLSGQIDRDCADSIKQASKDGGRIGLKTIGSREVCITKAKNYARDQIAKGISDTGVKGSLIKRIFKSTNNFLKSVLDPKELFNVKKQFFSKGAIASLPIFDAGIAGYEALAMNKPIKEAISDTLTFGSIPRAMGTGVDTSQVIQAKNLLNNPNLSPAGKEYAQLIIDQGEYEKLQSDVTGGVTKKFNKFNELRNKIKNASTAGRFDYESLLNEIQATQLAKDNYSPLIGSLGDPLKNRAVVERTGTRQGPGPVKIDLSPITYQNFKPNIASKKQVDDFLKATKVIPEDRELLQEFYEKEFVKPAEFELLMETPGFKGTQNRFAGGGIAKLAGIDEGPPPESGPNSQGLSGLLKRGNKI